MPDNQTTRTPISRAVDAAMLACPLLADGPAVSRKECEEMVRCAIATYLKEASHDLGQTVGIDFGEGDD